MKPYLTLHVDFSWHFSTQFLSLPLTVSLPHSLLHTPQSDLATDTRIRNSWPAMTRISRRNTRATSHGDGESPNHDNPNPRTRVPVARGRRGFGRIVKSTFAILFSSGILLILIGFYMTDYFAKESVKPRVVTPLPAPKLMDLPMVKSTFCSTPFFPYYLIDGDGLVAKLLFSRTCWIWLIFTAVPRGAQGEFVLGNV